MPTPRARKTQKPRITDEFTLRDSIHRTIDALIVSQAPLADGMPALLAVSRATCPSPLWEKLMKIKWAESTTPALTAFRRTITGNPPPAKLRAIFFQMPEIPYNDPVVDWIGMERYAPKDVDGEFVSGTLAWPYGRVPNAGLRINPLKRAASIAAPFQRDDDDQPDEDDLSVSIPLFACSMGLTCLLAAEIADGIEPKLLVKGRRTVGIAAGPAGGEYHALGELTAKGWKPKPNCWLNSQDSEGDLDLD